MRVKPGQVIRLSMTGFLLACTLVSQFPNLDQPSEVPTTRAVVINRNQQLMTTAYANISQLPGYRLTQHYILSDKNGPEIEYQATSDYDQNGNRWATIQLPNQSPQELYEIEGQQFIFAAQYQAWVDIERLPVEENTLLSPATLGIIENPARLMAQFGMILGQPAPDPINDRAATRYQLEPLVAAIAVTVEPEATALSINLTGNVWVDDESGALLKSEIFLHDNQTEQAIQEHYLEVSEIGQIKPINRPEPIVDPRAIVSATATAQVWTVLTGQMNYRGTPITFELIPLSTRQIPNTSPLSGEVEIIIRALPDLILNDGNIDPFLSQLRQQLTLSIPNRNLIVTSSGYKLTHRQLEEGILNTIYRFNVDLEDFQRVELILSGLGNPQFAPVPVE